MGKPPPLTSLRYFFGSVSLSKVIAHQHSTRLKFHISSLSSLVAFLVQRGALSPRPTKAPLVWLGAHGGGEMRKMRSTRRTNRLHGVKN